MAPRRANAGNDPRRRLACEPVTQNELLRAFQSCLPKEWFQHQAATTLRPHVPPVRLSRQSSRPAEDAEWQNWMQTQLAEGRANVAVRERNASESRMLKAHRLVATCSVVALLSLGVRMWLHGPLLGDTLVVMPLAAISCTCLMSDLQAGRPVVEDHAAAAAAAAAASNRSTQTSGQWAAAPKLTRSNGSSVSFSAGAAASNSPTSPRNPHAQSRRRPSVTKLPGAAGTPRGLSKRLSSVEVAAVATTGLVRSANNQARRSMAINDAKEKGMEDSVEGRLGMLRRRPFGPEPTTLTTSARPAC